MWARNCSKNAVDPYHYQQNTEYSSKVGDITREHIETNKQILKEEKQKAKKQNYE